MVSFRHSNLALPLVDHSQYRGVAEDPAFLYRAEIDVQTEVGQVDCENLYHNVVLHGPCHYIADRG